MSNAGFKVNIDLIRENFSIGIVQVASSLTHRTNFSMLPSKFEHGIVAWILEIFVDIVSGEIEESGKVRESDSFYLLVLPFTDAVKES